MSENKKSASAFLHTASEGAGVDAPERNDVLLRQGTVLELIATGASLEAILGELMRFIEQQETGARCGLLMVADDGCHFRRGSGPNLPEAWHQAFDGAPITPPYRGPCGAAVHSRAAVVVPDIAADERWSEEWRKLALSCGLASVRSTPVQGADGEVLAALDIYYDRPRDPTPADPRLIEVAAHLAAIALERSRAEALLKDRETQTRELLDAARASRELLQSRQELAEELAAAEQLQAVSTELLAGQNGQALYERILDAAIATMHSDCTSLQKLHPERGPAGELCFLAVRGFTPEAVKYWEWVRLDSATSCGEALRTGARAIVGNVAACDFMAGTDDQAAFLRFGILAVQSTPLYSRSGRLLGMISTHWRQPNLPTESELRRFDVLARQAADLMERAEAEAALRESESRYKALMSVSSQVLYRHNPDWSEMRQLQGGGFLADTDSPDPHWFDRYIHPKDQPRVWASIQEAIRTKSVFELEHRVVRVDGTLGWTSSRSIPLLDDAGEIVEWFGAASDVTERKHHEQHQQMLLNELNHRVKNTLATVQSIVMLTLRDSASPEQAQEQIDARLIALSRAHDILTRTRWEGARIGHVLTEATGPYGQDGRSRFALDGPDVWISARSALALSMALHELCTNAVKYGALSNGEGQVAIEWTVAGLDGARQLHMRWAETGGPPVASPKRRGFGSRLVERGLGRELGGKVSLEFAPTGVICSIQAPFGLTSGASTDG